MEKIVFKDWLEDQGCLRKYIQCRIERPLEDRLLGSGTTPYSWVVDAFEWGSMLEDWFWNETHLDWRRTIHRYTGEIVAGMPLDDPVGLALLLAELEPDYGKDSV